MIFVGNSSFCIEMGAFDGYSYGYCLSMPTLRAALPSDLAISIL